MSNRIKNNLKNLVGQTLNQYYSKVKPTISDLRYRQEYQNRIIECMVGEVDDNYITTPETDNPIVKLEHSKEGLVKVPSIKGKTILVDSDGNETDTPAEGCRLVSVGEEEDNKLIILSNNKNLFDLNIWKNNYYGSNKLSSLIDFENKSIKLVGYNNDSYTGTGATGGNKPHSDEYNSLIRVKPNTTYTLSMKVEGSANRINYIQEYDGNYNSLVLHQYGNSTNDCRTFTTKSNCKYIGFRIGVRGEGETLIYSNIQLEEKQSKTDYVEYKSHKTEILLDEPLRKLPNGVCDEIIGNKLVKRVGEVTFNGSENWSKYGLGENDDFITFAFSLTCSNKHLKSKQMWAQKQINRGRSNCLPSIGDKVYFNTINTEGFCQGHNDTATTNNWCIAISKSKLTTIDINGFKKWLSENPVTIVYELVEPIIEELPNGITLQGFDDTTMYVENSIIPTVSYGYNALIPYKEELRTQKEEVETNTLDIENNIIPYLMDMEFNLMLMEDK